MKLIFGICLVLLTACSPDVPTYVPKPGAGPKSIVMLNPIARGSGEKWISVRLNSRTAGTKVPYMSLVFQFDGKAPDWSQQLELTVESKTELAVNIAAQGAGKKAVFQKYAILLARQTYCRTGKITLNNSDRRISNPQDIQRIIKANGGRLLGGTVPAGIKGTRIPAIEFEEESGRIAWRVSLLCNARFPY